MSAFANTSVVVTGASQGIGRVLSLRLAHAGAKLVLAARSADRLEAVAAECRALGADAIALPTDITDHLACQRLIDGSVASLGGIDMLINNAGISVVSALSELRDLTLPQRVMAVNYLGAAYCTYYALPHLRTSRGRIVAVASLTGRAGVPLRSIYAASKHAMAGFFDSVRIEERPHGVSVTVAYPDFVQTEVKERVLGPSGERLTIQPGSSRFMTAERCAERILDAAARRRREVILSLRGRVGQWVKLVAPWLVDRMAARAMRTVRYD